MDNSNQVISIEKFTKLLPLGFIPFRLGILTLLEHFFPRNCGLVSVQVLEIPNT